MRKLNYKYFYLCYYTLNLINAYILITGLIHPNISNYQFTFGDILSSLIGNLGVMTLFLSLAIIIFPSTRARINFLTFASVIFTILCVGLAIFSNIFSTFFKFSHLESFQNPSQSTYIMFYAKYALSMIADVTQFIHLIPFIILLFMRLFINKEVQHVYSPIYKLSILFLSLICITIPIYKLDNSTKGTIYENSVNGIYGAHVSGVYNYYFYDFYEHYLKKEYTPTELDYENINEFLAYYENDIYTNPLDNKEYQVTNEMTGIAKDKNLLIIQLEAFNNFLINLEVDGVEITPNLNRLANNSLYYNRFYSSSGIGNTSDCEFSSLTGLYGNGNDLTIFSAAGSNYETLAKDFKKDGYHTFSFHGNVGDFYHRNQEHINTLGFDEFYPLEYFQNINQDAPLIHGYLDDKYFFKELPGILATQDKFFGYAISVTSHSPYVPTSEIPTHNFTSLTTLTRSYIDFVMYVDEAIGIFIDEMEKRNLLDDTVIVIYGDHTSSLFKKDMESLLQRDLTEVEFRLLMQNVPFIVYNEDLFAPTVNSKISSTVDVYRTMSNLFGLDSKYHFGNDLLTDEPNIVYSPRSLDIILQDSVIFYPSNEVYGKDIDPKPIIDIFTNYKYHNDLILKTKYFK